jgi:aminoglycoside N3'-acetyltransferase
MMNANKKIRLRQILKKILKKVPTNKKFILIHFNLIPFLNLNINLEEILTLIKKKFKNNIIIMPCFTFSFHRTKKWNYKISKSESGALSEFFRKISDGRTTHPIHSISYYGKKSYKIPNHKSSSSFGKESTWEWICESGEVLNLSIGSKFNGGATFIHYLEEFYQVPYREYKTLKGKIIDANNKITTKQFSYFARKNGFENSYKKCEDFLIKKSLIKYYYIKKIPFFFCDIKKVTQSIKKKLKKNIFYLACRSYSGNTNAPI